MPIRQGGAKLWFKTQQQIDEYDDKMIASIELKSTDFDDENFSPVFGRPKKEFLLKPGEKFQKDLEKLLVPYRSLSEVEFIEKYYGGKKNHTFWRDWPLEKFTLGWAFGYALLRELPLRNFYARCFVMFVYFGKIMDMTTTILPGGSVLFDIKADRYSLKTIKNYDAVEFNRYSILPNASNRIHEGLVWKNRQPAFLKDQTDGFITTYLANKFGLINKKVVPWDGTFNMPLERLADPLHKDAFMVNFFA